MRKNTKSVGYKGMETGILIVVDQTITAGKGDRLCLMSCFYGKTIL